MGLGLRFLVLLLGLLIVHSALSGVVFFFSFRCFSFIYWLLIHFELDLKISHCGVKFRKKIPVCLNNAIKVAMRATTKPMREKGILPTSQSWSDNNDHLIMLIQQATSQHLDISKKKEFLVHPRVFFSFYFAMQPNW
jgi:hypothetical protein